jgi:hypothetical protein
MNQWLPLIRFLGIRLAIYLAAVCVTYLLASITATQSVVASLAGMGVTLSLTERLQMTLDDILGMAGMLLPMVAFGLLIAFMATALVCRYRSQWRFGLYIIAGATAMLCMHGALNLAFSITPVAIARTAGGLAVQAAAGAAGGLTYVLLSNSRFARER